MSPFPILLHLNKNNSSNVLILMQVIFFFFFFFLLNVDLLMWWEKHSIPGVYKRWWFYWQTLVLHEGYSTINPPWWMSLTSFKYPILNISNACMPFNLTCLGLRRNCNISNPYPFKSSLTYISLISVVFGFDLGSTIMLQEK